MASTEGDGLRCRLRDPSRLLEGISRKRGDLSDGSDLGGPRALSPEACNPALQELHTSTKFSRRLIHLRNQMRRRRWRRGRRAERVSKTEVARLRAEIFIDRPRVGRGES